MVRMLATDPGNLSSISGTHMAEGKRSTSTNCPLVLHGCPWRARMRVHTRARTHTQICNQHFLKEERLALVPQNSLQTFHLHCQWVLLTHWNGCSLKTNILPAESSPMRNIYPSPTGNCEVKGTAMKRVES